MAAKPISTNSAEAANHEHLVEQKGDGLYAFPHDVKSKMLAQFQFDCTKEPVFEISPRAENEWEQEAFVQAILHPKDKPMDMNEMVENAVGIFIILFLAFIIISLYSTGIMALIMALKFFCQLLFRI